MPWFWQTCSPSPSQRRRLGLGCSGPCLCSPTAPARVTRSHSPLGYPRPSTPGILPGINSREQLIVREGSFVAVLLLEVFLEHLKCWWHLGNSWVENERLFFIFCMKWGVQANKKGWLQERKEERKTPKAFKFVVLTIFSHLDNCLSVPSPSPKVWILLRKHFQFNI